MCEPTTIAMAAMAIGSALVSHEAAVDEAEAQMEANRADALATNENLRQDYKQQGIRLQQEQEVAAKQVFENNLNAQRAIATQRVSAGESGVAGLSLDSLIGDLTGQNARNNMDVQQNLDNSRQQIAFENTVSHSNAEARVRSQPRPNKPSRVATGLQIGQAGMSSYNSYKAS